MPRKSSRPRSVDYEVMVSEFGKLQAILRGYKDPDKSDRICREMTGLLSVVNAQAYRWKGEPADSKEEPMPEEFLFGLRFGPVGEGDEDGASGPG